MLSVEEELSAGSGNRRKAIVLPMDYWNPSRKELSRSLKKKKNSTGSVSGAGRLKKHWKGDS